MKPLSLLICLFFFMSANVWASDLSSVVPLPGGGPVAANASLNLPLTGLTPAARYSVVCYINTTYPFQYLLLGTDFVSNTSTVFSYNINGKYLRQDQLIAGNNLVVIEAQFATPVTDTLVFSNLDQTNPFSVNNCFAVPVVI